MQSRSILERVVLLHSRTNAVQSSGAVHFQRFSRGDWSQKSAKDQQAIYASAELVITSEIYSHIPFHRDLLLSIAGTSQQPIYVHGALKSV